MSEIKSICRHRESRFRSVCRQRRRTRRFLTAVLALGYGLIALAGVPFSPSVYASDAAQGRAVTHVTVSRVQSSDCQTAPVTFGQAFVDHDVPKNETVQAVYQGTKLPTQVNVKARNRDGSARHAVINVRAPCDLGRAGQRVDLVISEAGGGGHKPTVSLVDVLDTDFDSRVSLSTGGKTWHLDARKLLSRVKRAGGCDNTSLFCKRWLSGPLASEWVVGAPLIGPNGAAHPHLTAYFAVRVYGPAPVKRVRVDVTVENDWAYVARPQNYHYRPSITVAGRSGDVYHPKAFTHYRQARWHHVVWWGQSNERPLYARLDSKYLQRTAAVPQYENGRLSSKLLHQRQSCSPMKSCGQTPHMETTGSQSAIGPLPRWSAAFVIDPDYRIFKWMLANTDALGAYDFHYRGKDTGQPLSLTRHPCATRVGPAEQKRCAVPPHGDDRFPDCAHKGACKSPLNPSISHSPAPAYTAYLATGDWYYKSELAFIADWTTFWQNPKYRDYKKALVHSGETRAQAWTLRTLGDAAYLLPDKSSHKQFFNRVVANNIDWYTKNYVNNPDANKLGVVKGTFPYPNGGVKRTGVATWQQSFFAWSIGNLADKRFAGAQTLLDWFAKFQISLMTSPDYCWELASTYQLRVLKKSLDANSFYDNLADVFRHSFPAPIRKAGCDHKALNRAITKVKGHKRFHYPPKTMVGYPKGATGFPANFQIGLAADYNANRPNAHKAWSIFAARPVQPNFSASPQFAVVPTRR